MHHLSFNFKATKEKKSEKLFWLNNFIQRDATIAAVNWLKIG